MTSHTLYKLYNMSVVSPNSLGELVTQSTRLTWRVGDATSWLAARERS